VSAEPLLQLFARAPRVGEAKTRLAADVGKEKTALIAAGLIQVTTELAVASWPGEVRLKVWPDVEHPVFSNIESRFTIDVEVQTPGDLGDKMIAALHEGIAAGTPTAVMGCDAPQCPPAELRRAADALQKGHNVFGPAEDGGFWLLGLTQTACGLFDGIDWDAPETGAQTLNGASRIGSRHSFRYRYD